MNNQRTFTQVQKWIDAGLTMRRDTSWQIAQVRDIQKAAIAADPSLTDEQKAEMDRKLEAGIKNRVRQFAPNWQYPPEEVDNRIPTPRPE